MTSDQIKFEEKKELCSGVSKRGRACQYPAIKDGKCGRCANKRSTPKPFKKGIDNPRGLNFGGRGWTTFLDHDIIPLALKVLSTPDYTNLTQEVEYINVELASMAPRLNGGTGYCFEEWKEVQSLFEEIEGFVASGENEKVDEAFAKMGKIIELSNENYNLKQEFDRAMKRKGEFIIKQQAIKEKEGMYVSLEKMMVFGAQLVQVIDAALPKHDPAARKYRQALYSFLAPKFGFEQKTHNRLTPMPDELIDTEDDYISDEELELLNDLSEELFE